MSKVTANMDNYWIGVSDLATEGNFVWLDGTTLDNSIMWVYAIPWNKAFQAFALDLRSICDRAMEIEQA